MKNEKLAILLRVAIAIAAFCILMLCISSQKTLFLLVVHNGYFSMKTESIYIQSIFYWCTSIPVYIILGFAWRTTYSIDSDNFFTKQLSNDLKTCIILMGADLGVFIIASIIFAVLSWNAFIAFAVFIFGLGVSLDILLYVAYEYVLRGIEMQDDLDGTV